MCLTFHSTAIFENEDTVSVVLNLKPLFMCSTFGSKQVAGILRQSFDNIKIDFQDIPYYIGSKPKTCFFFVKICF